MLMGCVHLIRFLTGFLKRRIWFFLDGPQKLSLQSFFVFFHIDSFLHPFLVLLMNCFRFRIFNIPFFIKLVNNGTGIAPERVAVCSLFFRRHHFPFLPRGRW